MPRENLQRLGELREEAEARALQCRFFVSWDCGKQGCREGPGVMGKTEPWLGHHLAIEKEKEKQPGFPLPLRACSDDSIDRICQQAKEQLTKSSAELKNTGQVGEQEHILWW